MLIYCVGPIMLPETQYPLLSSKVPIANHTLAPPLPLLIFLIPHSHAIGWCCLYLSLKTKRKGGTYPKHFITMDVQSTDARFNSVCFGSVFNDMLKVEIEI